MANKSTTLVVTHGDGYQFVIPNVSGRAKLAEIAAFFDRAAAGLSDFTSVDLHQNGTAPVRATATITMASVPVGTVYEINGVLFSAVSGTAGANEFDISGNDTADGAALAAAINASTSAGISGVLTATAATGVVTLSAVAKGKLGNAIKVINHGPRAIGTVTAATALANDTVTINGTTLTAKKQRATGTITIGSQPSDGDFVTINGITLTFKTTVTNSNTQCATNASTTTCATNLKNLINASTDKNLSGLVTATSASNVVTVRAVAAGTAANSYGLTESTATVRMTVSGATLSGGIAVANNEFDQSGTDAQTATDLARAVNASSTGLVSGHVVASTDGTTVAQVNLRALYDGEAGNCITLASSGSTLAVSGARLTGGAVFDTRASGTITISGGSGTITGIVNGVSCAVTWAASDTNTGTLLANKINDSQSALLYPTVAATDAAGVVTITALLPGVSGNAITLTATGTGATASGTGRLTGGAVATVTTLAQASNGAGGDVPAVSVANGN